MDRQVAYRFRSRWHIDAPAPVVIEALARMHDYTAWWPQVRRAEQVAEDAAELRIRSFLPLTLKVRATRSVEDRAAGLLEARLSGDLAGSARWTVQAHPRRPERCVVTFVEEVRAVRPLLARFDPWTRPFFRANHWSMMRAGRRGFTAYLAGFRAGLADGCARMDP